MLTVKDDGVIITLHSHAAPYTRLGMVLVVAVIISAIGVLMALGWLSGLVGVALVLMAVIGGYGWHWFTPKSDTVHLSGGQLRLTPYEFSHQAHGKVVNYRLEPSDSIRLLPKSNTTDNHTPMSLCIYRGDGKLLYQISGFSQPKHREVAQAVLQGTAVQAQGKAIRMQNSS